MGNPGVVYVLINSALPGMVKIGKTTGPAGERARQLSGTALPTEFTLVYEKHFDDCDAAELFVHTLLGHKGFRVTSNREFFNVSVPTAVDALVAADDHFCSLHPKNSDRVHESRHEPGSEHSASPAWKEVIQAAENARYGFGAHAQDETLAMQLYERAAKLGAPSAFLALAEMHNFGVNGRSNTAKAIDWLTQGARNGSPWCWAELADAHLGTIGWTTNVKRLDLALICFRNFFKTLEVSSLTDETRPPYFFRLKAYVQLAVTSRLRASSDDLDVIVSAGEGFIASISKSTEGESEKVACIKQTQGLVDWAKRAIRH